MRSRLNKDYLKLNFAILEDSMKLERGSNGLYSLSFKYDSKGPVLISIFTHVTDSAESIHEITQQMIVDKKRGCEEHNLCQQGNGSEYFFDSLNIDTGDEATFDASPAANLYPMMIRMVIFDEL